ncbi:MAG TPA: Gfo/Idh/MocA family oxidoreductase [Caldithrix abyssi]|uniref:Gfo/Idh/MocA family oxidoreductase n=1 Tax=Caldithrix abyssi TaxID=187145 RepID=A0A7V5RNU9_CALAY|nr:Gfo/Idh/MocA family oxidoreductase [Caldithrix abyssi]
MNDIKVGVIGVGHLGRLHTKLYADVPGARMMGVYDSDAQRAAVVGQELGCEVYRDMDALLDDVQAVSIVTPTTTHHEVAGRALRAGKHVFLEKPLTATEEEAEELIRLGREKNLKIQVGHIERFNGAVQSLAGVHLQPVFIEAHRLAQFNPRGTDVAVILDLMIHDLDLILHLVGSEPVKVAASGVAVVSPSVDIANARIEFANGCVANVTASRISAKKMRKMRVFQKNAYISFDFTDGQAEAFYIPDGKGAKDKGDMAIHLGQIDAATLKRDIKYTRRAKKDVNPLRDELQAFVEAVRWDKTPPVTAEEGLQALRLANRVMREVEKHQDTLKAGMG